MSGQRDGGASRGSTETVVPVSASSSWKGFLSGLLVVLGVTALMVATEPRLAMVWDEGYTLGREARLRLWFRALVDPAPFAANWTPPREELVQQVGAPPPRPDQIDTRAKLLFDPQVLAWFWPFAREEPHGHPPFYAILGLLGDVLTPGRPDLARARLGPILLFSLAAGVLFRLASTRWGTWPGIVALAAWTLQPNLFGHGHYATYDGILSSLWVLAIACYWRAVEPESDEGHRSGRWGWTMGFGVVLGCAMATKLTGWFLPLPFLAWSAWRRERRPIQVLVVGLIVGGLTLLALNPPWWTEPITGLVRFFRSNLTRGQTIPIPVLFLGKIYQTPNQSLPWYNTLVWTIFVTPVGFLALGLGGIVATLRRRWRESLGLLILGHWAMLMALRSMPHTPGHDGVRLFLPAFGLLALLAGLGTASWLTVAPRLTRTFAGLAVVEGIVGLILMMPVPLSYFSPVVGGLPGAARLGMEPTYYWDALDADALAWLRANTPPGQTIAFATNPTSWRYLRRTGELPPRLAFIDPGIPRWYVMQERPGAWESFDRQLVSRGTPAYTTEKFGVPLIRIYPLTGP